jgi:nitrate/TMAO reductase-like tetraheme cytochrome c subunit
VKRALALLVLAGACRVTPPHATAADASRANIELAELTEGRALMVTKCGNCHKPPMPDEHLAAEWPSMLDEMAERSNLDPHQRHLIQQYFVVMASR